MKTRHFSQGESISHALMELKCSTGLLTRRSVFQLMAGGACAVSLGAAQPSPVDVSRWLVPQDWQKQKDGPAVSLGRPGDFDDTHIFAPFVIFEKGVYSLLYPGSRDSVANRVYRLGLATSTDGVKFTKASGNPIYEFGDGITSVLTPALLRDTGGAPLRENGKLRMWFTGVDLTGDLNKNPWQLYEATGTAPGRWGKPSGPLLRNCYAPTIIKEGSVYHMWYTDISFKAWKLRHAQSHDGSRWSVTEKPVMEIDQAWEANRLIYPQVVKADGLYLMWYSSYWWDNEDALRWPTTSIGFAVSTDGLNWNKYENNPVLRPDADLPWETHYNSSQSVVRLPDGSWRMWYAARIRPPFINKYFSICTATWKGPQ